ncbi:MAG: hypothetical protein FH756_07110 [Firmicutes bacterium]|nr:hypothetical protein [Bacillota bacterium]
MRIAGLHINAYGILRDYTVDGHELDGSPVLVYGLNEAGKSTFMSFIRGVLFGFKAEGAKTVPVHGGQVGGWLLLENQNGEIHRVERTGKRGGKVSVELPDGTREGDSFLRSRILHGVSPVLFRNVFAIGMDELRKLEDLKKEEVSAHIYGAGTGVSPDRLSRAVNTLESSAREIFNPRGRVQKVNALLKELKDADRRIKQLEQQPARYLKTKDELAELEEEQISLGNKRRGLESRKSKLENLIKAREPWVKIQHRISRLKELEPVETFPVDGAARLEKLLERREAKINALRQCDLAVKDLQEALNKLEVDARLMKYGPQIKALNEERSLYTEKRQRLTEEEAKMFQLQEYVRERLSALGPQWDEQRVAGLDLSLTVYRTAEDFEEHIRAQEGNLRDIVREMEAVQNDRQQAQEDLKDIENELSSLPVNNGTNIALEGRFTALEQLNLSLQQTGAVEVEMEGERKRVRDLQARKDFAQKNMEGETGYAKLAWLPWLAAALGIAGLVTGGLNAGGMLLLAGGLGFGFLAQALLKKLKDQAIPRQEQFQREVETLDHELETLQANVIALGNRLQSLREKNNVLSNKLDCAPDIVLTDLPEIRRRLEQEREKQHHRQQLETEKQKAIKELAFRQRTLAEIKKQETGKQEELARLIDNWRQWCLEKGLPELKPTDIVSFLYLADKARDSVNKFKISCEEHHQVFEFVESYLQRANVITSALDMEQANRSNADSFIANLAVTLAANEADAERRRELQSRLEKAEADQKLARAGLRETEEHITELLEQGGAKEEEVFRLRAATYARREGLKQKVDGWKENLLSLAGSVEEYEGFCAELDSSTGDHNLQELEQVKTELGLLHDHTREVSDAAAEKRLRLEELEKGEELARARQDRDMLKERLKREAEQWRVRTLCSTLLNMAREKHERDRQPAVLLKASSYLQEMTRGRYRKVISPIGSPGQLEVEMLSGERVEASNLSRGAAGQLYLSLRLALAGHYSTLVAPFPVMLDDITVDFDRERLAGALTVIKEIAAEHQVLFFTCHRHILDMFREQLPGHKCLAL